MKVEREYLTHQCYRPIVSVCYCVFFFQRVLVQAAGSAPKGAQMQQISVPRVQQVPQQVISPG